MHHSKENQGTSTRALPIFSVGLVPHCRQSGMPSQSGLGGLQEASQQPSHLSFPGLQAGVCRLQGWGEECS